MDDGLNRYTMRELEQETESLALEILGQINSALTDFTKRTGVVVDLTVKLDGCHPTYAHNGVVCAPSQYHSWYFADVRVKPLLPGESWAHNEHQEELRIGFVAECEGKVYDDHLERWISPVTAPPTPSTSSAAPSHPQDPQT